MRETEQSFGLGYELPTRLPDGGYDQLWFRLKQLREGDIVVPYATTTEGYSAGMQELSENESRYIRALHDDRRARIIS